MLTRALPALLFVASYSAAQPLPVLYGRSSDVLSRTPVLVATEQSGSLEPGACKRFPTQALEVQGAYDVSAEGTRFTLLHLYEQGAAGLRVHFENVHLPENARLFVYGSKGAPFGPYEAGGPLQSGEFWTPAVSGPDVFVELQWNGESLANLPFSLTDIALSESPAEHTGAEDLRRTAPVWESVELFGQPGMAELREGVALLEGDIVVPRSVSRVSRNAAPSGFTIARTSPLWTGGILPYTISPSLPNVSRVNAAVQHWNDKLAGYVRLVPRTSEANYVQFSNSFSPGSCYSQVGMAGGIQYVNLGDYCSTGNAIHEIGHTLGLWHEHTRTDRDGKIVVHAENVDPNYNYNFNVQTFNAELAGSYDYSSIMHYSAYAFSRNGSATIETIPAGIAIGQRNALSAGDIAAVQSLYPAVTQQSPALVPVTVTTIPAGQSVVVDGVSAVAPQTYSWITGSSHSLSVASSTLGAGGRMVFAGWSNGGAQNQTILAPSAATTYAATYATQYQVSASVYPTGSGTVTLSPASGDGYYASNSTLSISASASSDFCFASWTGISANSAPQTQFTVDRNYSVVAVMTPRIFAMSQGATLASAAGGTGQVQVSTSAGCAWTPTSNADWLVLTGPQSFTGPATLTYAISPNHTGRRRFGAINAGGSSFTVIQSGL